MPSNAIVLKPGETLVVVAASDAHPSHPIMLPGMPGWGSGGPVDPGYSPPWAQVRPPVDPGYSPPWAQVGGPRPSHPIVLPGDPSWGGGPVDPGYSPPWAQAPVVPTHPIVLPPTEPPPTTPPSSDSGDWVWAWSPQLGRWVWVKVPGEGEAGPKA